jgi:hypothetical protein
VVGEDPQQDKERFFRTESGVVLITPEMLNTRTSDTPTA